MHEPSQNSAGVVRDSMPAPETEFELRENPRAFTRWQRIQIAMASWVGTWAVALVGRTLRWQVFGWENWEAGRKLGKGLIYTCWHREIFGATWFWRRRGIVVITSQNFDGEYIARIIQRHGYGAARGSSSRGGVRALVELRRVLQQGRDAAFTIDGPRGPRFIAKPGAVTLAKATGAAILCFHIAVRRARVLRKTWDLTEFPYPFSRAAVFIAPSILVPSNANDAEQESKLQEVQESLDRLVRQGDAWRTSRSTK